MNLKNTFTTVTSNRLLTAIFFFLSLTAFYGCNDNDELEEEARRREEAYNRQLAIDTVIIKDYIAKKGNITNVQRSPNKSGLFYSVLTPGTGDQATLGKTVVTHYVLTNLQGDTLDTSRKPRAGQTTVQPLTFILGRANILAGYQEGVSLMRVGERALFFLPSGLAYGDQAQEKIPANSVLIFDIELREVR